MTNPMGVVTNNPKAFIKSPSPVSGNMRLGVNNVAPIPNVVNPKSIGSPSANGYSQIPVNPKYTPYTGYEPLKSAVENPAQAVQTTAKTPISLGGVLRVAGKVLAVVGFVQTVQDIGTELGNLSNAIDLPRRQSEKDRLDKLINERERVAQTIAAARIDSWNREGRTSGTWVIQVAGPSHNATPFNGTGTMVVSGYSDDQFSTILGTELPTPGYFGVYLAKNGEIVSIIVVSSPRGGSGFLGGAVSISPSFQQGSGTSQPPAPFPIATPRSPEEWPYGSPLVTVSGDAAKMLDKMEAAAPSMQIIKGDPKAGSPDKKLDASPPAKPVANPPFPILKSPPPTVKPELKPKPPAASVSSSSASPTSSASATGGFISTPATQIPATQIYPNGMTNELYNKGALPEFKQVAPPAANAAPQYNKGSQIAPNPPAAKAPESFSIPTVDPNAALILGAIASGSATTISLLNQVNQQTSPDALKNAAKQGSCETLQSPSCTKPMEDRIKDPIMTNVDATKAQTVANAGAISSLAGAIATIWEFLQNRLGKVLNILNNTVVDRTLAVMNLVTNIHNAAMLTRDIGETLGSVVDNVISLTGLRFTNSEGAQVGFTDVIGTNFRAFLIQVLGAERYVELTLNWQKASMILNSAANIVNTTQSMLDPISSAVEYGMENVSKIGNSLKEDGVVSENAYPAMDETIRARRMNRFARLNDTLEGAENVASNLSSVTSSAVSVKEDYKQLREDAKDLKDKASAFNTADSEARAALKAELPTEITPITLAPAPAEDEEP